MATSIERLVPLDDQLCFLLYGASMAMGRAYKPMLDKLGITFPQYLVLYSLWEQDDRTIGAIADRLSLEPSTITPLVKRLVVAGLVDRVRDPSDERQVRVVLTARGRLLAADSRCLSEEMFVKTRLTVEQMKTLNDQVRTLQRVLLDDAQGGKGSSPGRSVGG